MKRITTTTILIIMVMMIGMAGAAVLEEDWEYGKRNVAPNGVEHAYWDFENGAGNLFSFNNQHPDIAVFLPVQVEPNPDAMYAIDEPSSVWDRGRAMHIYPWDHYWQDTARTIPVDFIYIVNGHYAFSPRTGPDMLGKYWPGRKAYVDFKADTQYVSFLACTGGTLYVNLYDKRGNSLSTARIYANIDRVGSEPSEFTRFEVHLPDKEIGSMSLSGMFNGWHIDDLIVGGAPGYLDKRMDYGWAAERMRQLIGAKHHDLGLGYLLHSGTYLTADEIKDDIADPYYDPFTKEMEFGEGICPEAAIIWAYNEDIDFVSNLYMNNQFKKDFTEDVAYEDIQPGDVFFIDWPELDPKTDLWVPDGQYDEVGIVIPPQYDPETGMYEDCIRVIPGEGVQYSSTELVNIMGKNGFVEYRSLPDEPRIGRPPYPKPHGKPI